MARQQEVIRTLVRLLAAGEISKAQDAVSNAISSLEGRLRSLDRETDNVKRELATLREMRQEIDVPGMPKQQTLVQPTAPTYRPSADEEGLVRMQVLKAAEDLAFRSDDMTVSVQGVVKAAEAAGIKLKPKARTQVGNMLWKANQRWNRVATGVYKLKDARVKELL